MKSYAEVTSYQGEDVLGWKSDKGGDELWIVHDLHCDNLECAGCQARICLLDSGSTAREVHFCTDLDKGCLGDHDKLSPEDLPIAEDFCGDEAIRRVLLRRRQLVRASSLVNATGPIKPWTGNSYHMGDFDPYEKHCPILYDAKRVEWLVIDQYCVSPSCPCNEALLGFHKMRSSKPRRSADAYTILQLKEDSCRSVSGASLTMDQLQIVADFKEAVPLWRRELSLRRKLTREIALKRVKFPADLDGGIAAAATTAKPSRNDPCSCGSGRKYKKCCGKS